MKKIFLLAVLFFIFFGNVAYAQNTTRAEFSILYNAYRKKYDEYLVAHDEYTLARSQYEKFDTLTSREKAQVETAKMLIKRDEVMVLYFTALKARLDDTSLEMDEARKNELKSLIDTEIQWYNEHKSRIKTNQTLKELVIISNEGQDHYYGNDNTIYLSLFEISRARMTRYDNRFDELFLRLTSLTETIKAEKRDEYKLSDSKIERIDRWIGEVNNKEAEYNLTMEEAVKLTPEQGDRNRSKNLYNAALESMEEALAILKQRISFVNEVIREIKISEK
ncbi:MAG TPA: hypothetical protein VI819_00470 [Patescibacteria group bacterium]|nr:hypothetical protein [Patescibacteria group bacterium]